MPDIIKDMEDFRFWVPDNIFKIPWDQYINDAEGEMSKMLKICKTQTETLQKFINRPSTPENLSWMILWTRNFNLVQGVISVLMCESGWLNAGSSFILRILWRLSFELWLTLNFILTESASPIGNTQKEKNTLEERLCGYLAWCLWSDKEFAHKMTQGWRLDTIIGQEKVRNPNTINQLNDLIELFWGDEDAVNDSSNKDMKRDIRKNSMSDRSRLLKWLNHNKLSSFEETIRNQRPSNYFELIDPNYKSISRFLSSSWNDACYPAYQDTSALIHGSTFKGHMEFGTDHIFPKIGVLDEDVQMDAKHVRLFCNFNSITLLSIQNRMIEDDLIK
jgi:hypothetical protein